MLGSPNFRPHIVEFIRGTGVRVNGVVVQDVGGSGPFTWVVPDDVGEIFIGGCGSGSGGGGGYNTGTQRGGGGGGGGGASVDEFKAHVLPGSTLTITVPAGGTGGAAGSNGTRGDATRVVGLLSSTPGLLMLFSGATGVEYRIPGAYFGNVGGTGGGNGGMGGNSSLGSDTLGIFSAGGSNGSVAAATPSSPSLSTDILFDYFSGARVHANGGVGGGGASTVPTTNGAGTPYFNGSGGRALNGMWAFSGGSTGYQDGTNSYGAGGQGGLSMFGSPGIPGTGATADASNSTAQGYGYGGSGGRGGGAGSSGGAGYCTIRFMSAR